jgi:hypothetical protein
MRCRFSLVIGKITSLQGILAKHRVSAVLRISGLPPNTGVVSSRCAAHFLAGIGASKTMVLGNMRLLLESFDGSPANEYRVEDGNVEVRTLDPEGVSVRCIRTVWRRLTPGQLSNHVERNTVVAQWLERRLGWRWLLQACVADESPTIQLPDSCQSQPRVIGL